MALIRRFEEEAGRQYQRAKAGGFLHLAIGEEATIVGTTSVMRDEDYLIGTYRTHGHAIARGTEPKRVMAELFGRVDGASGGRGGSMHIFDRERRFMGGYGIVGGNLPIAAGLALSSEYKGEDAVTVCMFGDGASNTGNFGVAGVGGAVAEHADGDRVLALVLGGEGQAGGDRQVAADDPVAAHEALLAVEDVHRAAAAAAGPVDAAEELRHHPLRLGAAGDRVAVRAVGADQVVLVAHYRGGADDRRLLADPEVQEAARFGPLVLPPGLLLEAADQGHPREQLVTGAGVGEIRHALTLASRRDCLFKPVIAPEDLVADEERGDADHTQLGGPLGRLPQGALDAFRAGRLEQRVGVQLAGRRGDQHVVVLAQVAPGGEGLAEGGEGEGDGAAGLLGEGRGPHREQRVAGPGLGPDRPRQPVGDGPPFDLGDPLLATRPVRPGVAAEVLEEPTEQDRLPLGLLQLGVGEQPADPLRGQVRVRRTEIEVKGGAGGAQAWIAQPSTARAASKTASEIVGWGWTICASSW